MTKEDVKKRLECAARITGNDLFVDAYKIIIEQEKSIQEAQDSILSLAQQNQEYREQQVKQAKIDILNKLKERLYSIFVTKSSPLGDITVEDIAEDIDELIKEVQNAEDNN